MAATAAPAAAPDLAPVPPHNLDAEESILGALLLDATGTVDRVHDAGLRPSDFYRETHGQIYAACLALRRDNIGTDPIAVADKLARDGLLDRNGGVEKIHELATLVPAVSNVLTYVRIVIDEARRRDLIRAGSHLARIGYDQPGTVDDLEQQAREILEALGERGVTAGSYTGYTHQEVLQLELAADRYLIEDLIPAGTVGTIAGVPETHKSWLAQAIAVRVARGAGWVLGKPVLAQGPVGYFWQDDSTREEAERVKAFEDAHNNPADLPIRWFLNEHVELPRDIRRMRATVEELHLTMIVLDSFYNFLPGADLKDEHAEQIVGLLKREISDATGCTVLIVDHMPWATETNRQRLRAYGGVFKNAATRYGIYIDAAGDKLHIEARGNNIKGITKTLAYWDDETLELKLIHHEEIERDDLVSARIDTILEWLNAHPGRHTKTTIREAVGGKSAVTDDALQALVDRGDVINLTLLGSNRPPGYPATGFIASIHAGYDLTRAAGSDLTHRVRQDSLLDTEGDDQWTNPTPTTNQDGATESLSSSSEKASTPGQSPSQPTAPASTTSESPKTAPSPSPTSSQPNSPTPEKSDPDERVRSGQMGQTRPSHHGADLTPESPIDETSMGSGSDADRPPENLTRDLTQDAPRPHANPAQLAEQWIRDEGWMLDDPAATLLTRWPALPTSAIAELVDLAAHLAAAELEGAE